MSRKAFARSGREDAFAGSAFRSSGNFGAFACVSKLSYLAELPDFSSLIPSLAVPFKSLSLKKDDATKTRALSDITTFVKNHAFVSGESDGVLAAWVKLYPRTAIDTSNRVRELSHCLQYEIMRWGRKHMEKHIPAIVGSWLTGTFDRYKPAARAATDGLTSFLNTPERLTSFWKKCQLQILEYAIQAARETPETLSDDRDRADRPVEARTKFLRVIGGGIGLVVHLFSIIDDKERSPYSGKYDEFLSVENVWDMASAEDQLLRKSCFQLLSFCLDHKRPLLDNVESRFRCYIVSHGLNCDQTGSSVEFLRVLTKLTKQYPGVWAASGNKTRKKSPVASLQSFIEKGSQGGTGAYWVCLDRLLAAVPLDVSFSTAEGFAHAMRIGISNRFEPRQNATEAWACYVELLRRYSGLLRSVDESRHTQFIQQSLFPLTSHYLSQEPSLWATGGQAPILLRAHNVAVNSGALRALETEWEGLAENVVARMASSLPEKSSNYQTSQETAADAGGRWFTLVGAIANEHHESVAVLAPSRKLVTQCIEILERRNFKPFGLASTIEAAANKLPTIFGGSDGPNLVNLICDNIDSVLPSPSCKYLFSSVRALSSSSDIKTRKTYRDSLPRLINAVVGHASEPNVAEAVATLISNGDDIGHAVLENAELQSFIAGACLEYAEGKCTYRTLFESAFSSRILAGENARRVVRLLIESLDSDRENANTLPGIELIAHQQPEAVMEDEALHVDLLAKLFGLSHRHTPGASKIKTLLDKSKPSSGKSAVVTVIQSNLSWAGHQSLEIHTLVDQANWAVKSGTASLNELLPDLKVGMQELIRFFHNASPPLSLSCSLGGAQFLVSTQEANDFPKISGRDRLGVSVPARMALYTLRMLSYGPEAEPLLVERRVHMIYFLMLTSQLASDQITMMNNDRLWKSLSTEVALSQAEEVIKSTNKILHEITTTEDGWAPGSLMGELMTVMVEESKALNPPNLYAARCLAYLFRVYSSARGFSRTMEECLSKLDLFKVSPKHALGASAVLSGLSELLLFCKPVINFCNRLVSDVPDLKPEGEKTLMTLVLLNSAASVFDPGSLPVANNRVVFAVQRITAWFADPEELDHRIAIEACKSLQKLLPCMKSIYGSYWEDTLTFCTYLLQRAEGDPVDIRLPYVHAALRLEACILSLEDPNDDLVEAIENSEKERSLATLELLSLPRGPETQPQTIVESLLCRRVDKIPLKYVKDAPDIYRLVASESRHVQTAAFNILHKALPEQQQQISVNVALDRTCAKLPDELLSLLLEPPTLEHYSDDALALFPTEVRSYLLTWLLIFDTFSMASHKVQGDYTAHLKACDSIIPLLDFTFDVLGHSAASPLKLEREGFDSSHILSYDVHVADSEPEEKNMHWLLLHIFYRLLECVPGLFKAWHINCKTKQTKIAVRGWTEKYYSPLVIEKALDAVAEWARDQDAGGNDDDEKELNVKVVKPSREVIAGYEVDDLEASISIKLATDFPLGGVTVSGIKRVVVAEKKWQSWMIVMQGVIMFSVSFCCLSLSLSVSVYLSIFSFCLSLFLCSLLSQALMVPIYTLSMPPHPQFFFDHQELSFRTATL